MGSKSLDRLVTCAALALAGCLAVPAAAAASFDCDAARTRVEHAICASDSLHRADETLAEAYGAVRNEMPAAGRASLLREQRAWLRQRDACVVGDVGGAEDCLRDAMQARNGALDERLIEIRDAFDRAVLSIPSDPAAAAAQLGSHDSSLAQAWMLYLGRHEPEAGVPKALADDLRRQSRNRLRESDGFASSILDDIYDGDEALGDLTLLRMWLERSYYGAGRPYVHCFVFRRQPTLAYRAMGALYGSTRDASAPICAPEGDLFESVEWKRLQAAFAPVVARTHGMDAGTIRFADFAEWRIRDLRLTLAPLDYLDPKRHGDDRVDPARAIDGWEGSQDGDEWSRAARDEAHAALEQAQRATVAWLQAERSLSPEQAAGVAEGFLQAWVAARIGMAGDGPP